MISKWLNLKAGLIFLIRLCHYVILIFVIFGWVFRSQNILFTHLVIIPLVILQWKINQGRCYLTDLENYLKKTDDMKLENQSEGFIHQILRRVFRIQITANQLLFYIYLVMAVSFLISLTKVTILN